MADLFRLINPGLAMSYQDAGRKGYLRFGVPWSGAMDSYAAVWANRLLGNKDDATVVEWGLQGGELEVLEDCWLAGCGAVTPQLDWSACFFRKGECIPLRPATGAVWSYLAISGGFQTTTYFGSHSTYERAGFGQTLEVGHILCGEAGAFMPSLGTKQVHSDVRETWTKARLSSSITIALTKGSGWESFSHNQQEHFMNQRWQVSQQSDRTGYRLDGVALAGEIPSIKSEPVLPGTIQVTTGGWPIVTMVDGPTVGGYAKIAFMEKEEREKIAQCPPGTEINLTLKDDAD